MNEVLSPVNNKSSIDTLFKPDGWSSTTRIGVVVPHADVGPEAELGAMVTEDISIHGNRIFFSAMRGGGEMDEKIPHSSVETFIDPPYLDDAVEALCTSPLDVIGLAFTSSAYKHGPQGERALIERLKPRSRGIPIVTTCLAAESALSKLAAKKIAIVNPAWFDNDLSTLGANYFEQAGFKVAHHGPCGLPSGQNHVTPEGLYNWIAQVVAKSGADTVFVAGNGQRSIGIIDAVEKSLGVSMITGNQLILWGALQAIHADVKIRGYGKIFEC